MQRLMTCAPLCFEERPVYVFVKTRSGHGRDADFAYISEATKRELERYAEAHGVKKG